MPLTFHCDLWFCFCFNFLHTSVHYFLHQGLKARHFQGESERRRKKKLIFNICHYLLFIHAKMSRLILTKMMAPVGREWRWLRLSSSASTPRQVQGSHCIPESKVNHVLHHPGCTGNLCPSLRVSVPRLLLPG